MLNTIKQLTPIKFDVFLYYKCPHCGSTNNVTQEEAIKIGGTQCYCGEVLKFKKIQRIVIEPVYQGELASTLKDKHIIKAAPLIIENTKQGNTHANNVVTPCLRNSDNDKFTDDAVSALVNLGYKKGEAKTLVSTFLETYALTGSFQKDFAALIKKAKTA